ncbi:hypothetical protein FACS1894195_0310 [Bacteroidia bacterium]|nr:hypothetical protein FACS1894195_0310 [Bacteroidia bacterium]
MSIALDSAKSNKKIKQIWVAAGTYTPQHAADGKSTNQRDRSFLLVDSVKMYGGFAGTETDINQRPSIAGRPTSVLSGDLGNDGTINNNAYHVLVGARITSNTVLDGFTVTGGNANGTDSIRIGVSQTDTLLVHRYNGGGIHLTNSSPILANLFIEGNTAKNGGGIYSLNSNPKLINSIITNNTADDGSAYYGDILLPTVSNFSITGGYTGPATITYMDGSTFSVTVNAAGDLEYASGTAPTGDIRSITLPGGEEILIGREAPSASNKIELSINGDGVLGFRSPDTDGNTPIGSYAEFQLINTASGALAGNYKLQANLDLMGVEWTPVGQVAAFTGTFDGNGKKLDSLKISGSTTNNVGLFGWVSGAGAEVKNLGIAASGSVTGTGKDNVGGVAGKVDGGGTIAACYNKSTVAGGANVGGIAGIAGSGTITACYNTGQVSGTTGPVGGIVGNSANSSITACYNAGVVNAGAGSFGGISGNGAGTINSCYNNRLQTLNAGGGTQFTGSFPDVSAITSYGTSTTGSSGYWKPGTTSGGSLPKLWFE